MYRVSVILVLFTFSLNSSYGGPVHKLDNEEVLENAQLDLGPDTEITVIKNITDNDGTNSTKDLFVIKTVVYEIGILTDVGNDTDFDNKTHEQIDIAFFDPESNGTFVDLSRIPIPVQTNVSGVSITGILPANFGDLALLNDGTPTVNGSHFPLFPNKQVKVSHNISTYDKGQSNFILEGLPEILGLKDILKQNNNGSSQEKSNEGSVSKEDNSKEDGDSKEDDSKEDKSNEKDSEERRKELEKKLEAIDTEEIE